MKTTSRLLSLLLCAVLLLGFVPAFGGSAEAVKSVEAVVDKSNAVG